MWRLMCRLGSEAMSNGIGGSPQGSWLRWDLIPAIKGVQFGNAFADACALGSQVHDEILSDQQGSSTV